MQPTHHSLRVAKRILPGSLGNKDEKERVYEIDNLHVPCDQSDNMRTLVQNGRRNGAPVP